jgi:hypothetical protein
MPLRGQKVDLLDTDAMDDLFERLERMNEVELLAMRAAWRSTSRQEHEDAWTAVKAVGAIDGLTDEIDRVREAARTWASIGSNVAPQVLIGQVQNWHAIKAEATEAIVDVALAVALEGRLDQRHYDVLIWPWLSAMATPD